MGTYPYLGSERGSRIGIHTLTPGQAIPILRQMVAQGTPPNAFKAVQQAGMVVEAKRISPGTITVLRLYTENDPLQGLVEGNFDVEGFAQRTIEMVFQKTSAEERAAADFIEVINEPDPNSPDPNVKDFPAGYAALARVCIRVMQLARARGLHLALPALNAGTPEYGEMRAMVDAGFFREARSGGHMLTLHEGVFGDDQPVNLGHGGLIPGAEGLPPNAGTLCGRWLYLYSLVPASEIVPLFISEFYAGGGYSQEPRTMVERVAWYDKLVRLYPYVVGFGPFTLDPTGGWVHQDYTPFYPALLQYMAGEKDKANPMTLPTPPPPSTVPPGSTHVVSADALNVRAWPWIYSAAPPIKRTLRKGDGVKVLGGYQHNGQAVGWANLSERFDEWVNMRYLTAL